MKILVASHTYIVDLNREKLRKMVEIDPKVEVTVVVPKRWRPGGVQNKIIDTEPVDEGRFRVIPLSHLSQNNQGLLMFGLDLNRLLKSFQPQIIQTEQGAKALSQAQLIALNKQLKLNAKNVFFTWWNLPYETQFPLSILHGYNLRGSHGIITGNQDGMEVLRDFGYEGPMKVMPQLGVDEELFAPQPQPQLKLSLGINSDDFVVGFVGRFVEEKGLFSLFNALKEIKDRPWKWVLLGRGSLKQELLDRASELGLRDKIICIDSVPHDLVYQYINLMDVLVLPSETTYKFKTLTAAGWKEQFGHVLIEAMACKVPVIGSDSGEIPYVIDRAGLVFPEANVDALRQCLLQVMDDESLRQNLAEKGYNRVMDNYTNTALAKQQLEFYQQLL
ncbi:hormogonium polysaccharide biosynthesis glycosyltransferase HpsO [Roseofilum casamattae]|uniref:Hormogonium polysaccharide biosynthesis glycosyltransferase HpsO n=1 Tax=Roseofilum casamattae BLCC-M143 TaxID=3022442 RepID=A0ABT7BSV7_9CYAN|nr:hormogonium polysaccharide biosynthesis glycosyltransferase HpsO [Roseofilum casamattae]MDJ1182277.1 hormogonium polysaccharide biosynthesis glycosyltransferase HpsO [Roseofilum casamattae BLCC-M143]